MPKVLEAPSAGELADLEVQPPTAPPKSTLTNWKALRSAGLAPVTIECNGYRQYHSHDNSCHTKIVLKADAMLRHARDLGHGGGFTILLKRSEKPWPGWEEFEKLGLEAADFTCEVCDKKVPFHPSHIHNHVRTHVSKNRRPTAGGVFNLTIQVDPPTPAESDAFADAG